MMNSKPSEVIYEKLKKKLKLRGFNNLTKSLSFNIYDISYAPSQASRKEYLEYIDEEYNAARLNKLLKEVVKIIGANILSSSIQDYDPMGASATLLISEENIFRDRQVMHLDKSHVSAHTYPESDDKTGLATFRVDIDVSTCGRVSPLKALDFLIKSFDSDVVIMDYKVRGFTRDIKGRKHYSDHKINSVIDFISPVILKEYKSYDINIFQENLYHTKMISKHFNLDDYLFKQEEKMDEKRRSKVEILIQREMEEIFHSKNIF